MYCSRYRTLPMYSTQTKYKTKSYCDPIYAFNDIFKAPFKHTTLYTWNLITVTTIGLGKVVSAVCINYLAWGGKNRNCFIALNDFWNAINSDFLFLMIIPLVLEAHDNLKQAFDPRFQCPLGIYYAGTITAKKKSLNK